MTNYFNYQNDELAKSLILFSKADFIYRSDSEGIEYYKAHGVNCYGNGLEKKSYEKKLEWFKDNEADILNYNNTKLLAKAEKKYLFLAFCLEYKQFYKWINSEELGGFPSYLPIQLDATCNGYKHLALLANESKIYKVLNLTKTTKKDNPEDFYGYISSQLSIALSEKKGALYKTDPLYESYDRLSKLDINRKNIKNAIMTKPYNATPHTLWKYIKATLIKMYDNELENKDEKDQNDNNVSKTNWYYTNEDNKEHLVNDKDIALLVSTLNNLIYIEFPKIYKVGKYLESVAELCNELGMPITWELPTGLIVSQQYLEIHTQKIKPFAYRKTTMNISVTDKMKLDKNKQKIALMPNLIHSLEKAYLTLLKKEFSKLNPKINNFYSVHDCFAVTADMVKSLITIIKSVYIYLYTEKEKEKHYLRKFD